MYEYKCKIVKVVDGDTVDIDLDLGFGVWLRDERVRIMGIDTPESRTSDKVEKIFGLAAKERLNSLLGDEAILISQVTKGGENMKGKFGRILGDFKTIYGKTVTEVLMSEGHAVAYEGGDKALIQARHLSNREKLIMRGKVILPEGYVATKRPLVTKPEVVEEVVEPAAPVLTKEEKIKAANASPENPAKPVVKDMEGLKVKPKKKKKTTAKKK